MSVKNISPRRCKELLSERLASAMLAEKHYCLPKLTKQKWKLKVLILSVINHEWKRKGLLHSISGKVRVNAESINVFTVNMRVKSERILVVQQWQIVSKSWKDYCVLWLLMQEGKIKALLFPISNNWTMKIESINVLYNWKRKT